ncbi:MAG TPA: NADP-dependent oxidoreductase [Casimicrobiaceae bacterium]|nr:NADP-dependent oxidoreductase [Casimicrobiaceae bacterium]
MRAIVFKQFGAPEVLQMAELPEPVPAPGEALVRVAAAGVNPTDVLMRSGQQAKLMTDLKPPYICGQEFSGHVHALGGASTRLKQGQAVMGIVNPRRPQGGAYAEYVCVPERSLVAAPENIDLVDAATIPMNGLTARVALQALALPPGATLLVTGGAGALGGYVIQLANDAGIAVIADAKEQDRALLIRLGAREVVPRGEGMTAAVRDKHPAGVDGLVDAALIGDAVAALVRDGGGVVGVRAAQPYDTQRLKVTWVSVLNQITNTESLEWLAERVRRKVLTPRISHRIHLADAKEAHRLVDQGGLRGRVVLVP